MCTYFGSVSQAIPAVSPYFTVLCGLSVEHKVFVVYGTYTHNPMSHQPTQKTTTNEQEMLNENQWKCVLYFGSVGQAIPANCNHTTGLCKLFKYITRLCKLVKYISRLKYTMGLYQMCKHATTA